MFKNKTLSYYDGNYDEYVQQREDRQARRAGLRAGCWRACGVRDRRRRRRSWPSSKFPKHLPQHAAAAAAAALLLLLPPHPFHKRTRPLNLHPLSL